MTNELFDCNHPKVEKFVRNEVIYCVTYVVNELLNNDLDTCDYWHLRGQDDYAEAVEQQCTNADLMGYFGLDNEQDLNEQLKELDESDYQDIAEHFDLEPYINEVYEYWIVSNFLVDRLEAEGEIVEKDFHGLTIWGRCTTGQSITCDYVIQKIITDLHNEVESWAHNNSEV